MKPHNFLKTQLPSLLRSSFWWTLLGALILSLTACSGAQAIWGNKPLSRPNGVVVMEDGTLWVMDKGNFRVVHLSPQGKVLESFGKFGEGSDEIFYGWDLGISPDGGTLYFSNIINAADKTTRDGVKAFSLKGKFIREIGAMDYTSDQEYSNSPYALEIDDAGYIYVADYSPGTMRVFSPEGELLTVLFGEGGEFQFEGLGDVAIDDTRGWMYVADFDGGRVEKFRLTYDEAGIPIVSHELTIGEYGREPGQLAFPQGIAVDEKTGLVYVGDQANRRVQVFDGDGQALGSFTQTETRDWQALGLTVGPDGNIYVADSLNSVIWVFTPEGELVQRIEVK